MMPIKPVAVIKLLIRLVLAAWLTVMGLIGSFMVFNEVFDPEFGQASKERFPVPPEWYIVAFVGIAAIVCFSLAYLLVKPRRKEKKDQVH